MQRLTDSFLKDIYDKCFDRFKTGIDPQIHADAYVGIHTTDFAETEFAGKYIDTCARFYRDSKDEKILANMKKVVESIKETQLPSGCLGGGYAPENAFKSYEVWNQASTMYGLISYYEQTGDEEALGVCDRCAAYIANYYLNEGGDILDSANNGTQHLLIMPVLPKLYQLTKNEIHKEFLEHIVDRLKNSDNNFFDFDSILNLRSRKGIENFCALIGMMMYGELTGDESAFSGCKKYWNELKATQIGETGNGTESERWLKLGNTPRFLDVDVHPNENCVAVGWIEFSTILFNKYKEAKYLDKIEQTVYNHIIGSLDSNCEDFAYYQPNFGKRITRTASTEYKCCRYRGYSAMSFLTDLLYHIDGDTIIPMLYTNSEYESNGVKIIEKTNYPFDDTIEFTVSGKATLKLRVPAWCKNYTVKVNGEVKALQLDAGYVTLSGDWDADKIELCFNTEVTVKSAEISEKQYMCINYGTVLMVLDSHFGNDVMQTQLCYDSTFKRVDNSIYNLEFATTGYDRGEAKEIHIVDYASAGKQSSDDCYTVWIAAKND